MSLAECTKMIKPKSYARIRENTPEGYYYPLGTDSTYFFSAWNPRQNTILKAVGFLRNTAFIKRMETFDIELVHARNWYDDNTHKVYAVIQGVKP